MKLVLVGETDGKRQAEDTRIRNSLTYVLRIPWQFSWLELVVEFFHWAQRSMRLGSLSR